jgi:hypothetical protein
VVATAEQPGKDHTSLADADSVIEGEADLSPADDAEQIAASS